MAGQSRHESLDVLRDYVGNQERFDDHAATWLLGARLAELFRDATRMLSKARNSLQARLGKNARLPSI